jgi:hypothetical protein
MESQRFLAMKSETTLILWEKKNEGELEGRACGVGKY